MSTDIVVHSTLPALASYPDTSTNLPKSWTVRQFETTTVLSALLSLSIADSLLCKDMADCTPPTLIVRIANTLVQPPTNSLQLINWGVPCHAFLEHLNLTWRVKAECSLFPSPFYNPSDSSSSEPGLAAVLKAKICLFWFLTFSSIIAILDFNFPLLPPPPELVCPPDLADFLPPFLFLRSLRTLSFSFLLSASH